MLLRLCPASRLTQEGSDLAFTGSNIAAFNRTAFFWKIRFYFWKAKKLLLMWAKCYNRGFEFTKGLIFFLCAVVPPICWLTYTTYISLDSILVHTHVSVSAGERFPLRLELMRVEPRSSRSVKRGPPRTDNDMGEEIIRFNFPTLSQMLTGKNYLVFISRKRELLRHWRALWNVLHFLDKLCYE